MMAIAVEDLISQVQQELITDNGDPINLLDLNG
jgi:hypothetical protein